MKVGNSEVAVQIMQQSITMREQTQQQLQVTMQKMDESKQAALQSVAQSQAAASERKSNMIDVMA